VLTWGRCTARLVISVLQEGAGLDEEMLSRLCAIFRAAANHSIKSNGEEHPHNVVEWPLLECEWWSKNGYNLALQMMRRWPPKYVIDLMQHSSDIRYPKCILPEQLQAYTSRQMRHAHQSYVRAVLYTTQARAADSSWSLNNMPRTAYHSRTAPSPGQMHPALYARVIDMAKELKQAIRDFETASSCPPIDFMTDLRKKHLALMPLAFEAALYINDSMNDNEPDSQDPGTLTQLIEEAYSCGAPPKTYALFADMTLSAVTADGSTERKSPPQLPISKAADLLRAIISAVRSLPAYDVVQASRWIRCIVQMILDRRPPQQSQPTLNTDMDSRKDTSVDDTNLSLVNEVVAQALILARDAAAHNKSQAQWRAQESKAEKTPTTKSYPSEELEWLATSLFNLAVDLYVAERENLAKKWAEKALEVADLLALPVLSALPAGSIGGGGAGGAGSGSVEAGDGGMLAGVMRGKMEKLGWLVG